MAKKTATPKAAKNSGVKMAAEKAPVLSSVDVSEFEALLASKPRRGRAPIDWDAIVLGITPGAPQVISPSGKTEYKSTTNSHPCVKHLRDAAKRNNIDATFLYDTVNKRIMGMVHASAVVVDEQVSA